MIAGNKCFGSGTEYRCIMLTAQGVVAHRLVISWSLELQSESFPQHSTLRKTYFLMIAPLIAIRERIFFVCPFTIDFFSVPLNPGASTIVLTVFFF